MTREEYLDDLYNHPENYELETDSFGVRRYMGGYMPIDKSFVTDDEGTETLCHATGYEICLDNDPDNWWNEYENPFTGELYLGR